MHYLHMEYRFPLQWWSLLFRSNTPDSIHQIGSLQELHSEINMTGERMKSHLLSTLKGNYKQHLWYNHRFKPAGGMKIRHWAGKSRKGQDRGVLAAFAPGVV